MKQLADILALKCSADIEDRFDNLTASQQQDAEVIDARMGKASLKAKLQDMDTAVETHKAESVSYVVTASRDLSLDGAQAISGFGFAPKAVFILATVQNQAHKGGWGFATSTGQYSIYNDPAAPGAYSAVNIAVSIKNTANDVTRGIVSLLTDGISIDWTKIGNGATGTINLFILALSHY